ncbi:MAG TPA: hypothetical protein VMZ00_18035 [Sporichthya sp.]|nr:hypothetical protein [Sporichthya sp.]
MNRRSVTAIRAAALALPLTTLATVTPAQAAQFHYCKNPVTEQLRLTTDACDEEGEALFVPPGPPKAGPTGPAGPAGPTGATGATGAPGTTNTYVVVAPAGGTGDTQTALCNAGDKVTGGGGQASGASGRLQATYPSVGATGVPAGNPMNNADGWTVVDNDKTNKPSAYVICADTTP